MTSVAAGTAPASDVAMSYISVDDAKAKLDDSDYVFFDVRKAEDYATGHIPGALSYDMDAGAARASNLHATRTTHVAHRTEKAALGTNPRCDLLPYPRTSTPRKMGLYYPGMPTAAFASPVHRIGHAPHTRNALHHPR